MKKIMLVIFLLVVFSEFVAAGELQYTIHVSGMSCQFCVATSEKSLKKIDGVHKIKSNLKEGTIAICADEKVTFTDEQLKKLFLENGFAYQKMETSNQCTL